MFLIGFVLGVLCILLVEDLLEDVELMFEQMFDVGLDVCFECVESEVELCQVLVVFQLDIVLFDLSMLGFFGDDVLCIVCEILLEVFFIFVFGMMGEENVVVVLQKGVNDYIIKYQFVCLLLVVVCVICDVCSVVECVWVEIELMCVQWLESLLLFVVGFSYDLCNILQLLLIMLDLLKVCIEDLQLYYLVDVIVECGCRGYEMVELMLLFVCGLCKLSECIEIDGLFDVVVLLLCSNVFDVVCLELQVQDEGLVVDVNYIELQQVMLNLVFNVIQVMFNGGCLSLIVSYVGQCDGVDWMCICVVDEGIGMDVDMLLYLFNLFFIIKVDGIGLGLIFCKCIVEGVGGSIYVSS